MPKEWPVDARTLQDAAYEIGGRDKWQRVHCLDGSGNLYLLFLEIRRKRPRTPAQILDGLMLNGVPLRLKAEGGRTCLPEDLPKRPRHRN